MNFTYKALRTVFLMTLLVAVLGFTAHSQTLGDVLERVRAIKFLEMNRSDIKQVLYEMTFEGTYDNRDDFTYGDFDIEVYYSTGECDEDEDEIFEADAGKAVRVVIFPSDELKIEQLGFDISKLKKEQKYRNNESILIYHDKKLGLAIEVDDGEVDEVILFPPISSKTKPCGNDKAREFVKMKSWFGSTKLQDRTGEMYCAPPASVTGLSIEREILEALTSKRVNISTTAYDAENDVLTYIYNVSAGQIIGTGKDVIWDLTAVPPGTYTITAGVSDGCVLCGATVTKTVVIK